MMKLCYGSCVFSGERASGFHQILPKIHEKRSLRTTAVNYEQHEDMDYVLFIFVVLRATCIMSCSNQMSSNA